MSVKLDDTIYLLNCSLPGLRYPREGFSHKNTGRREESIQDAFKKPTPFVGVIQYEQMVEVFTDV